MIQRYRIGLVFLGVGFLTASLCQVAAAHDIAPEETKCLIERTRAQSKYRKCIDKVVVKYYRHISFTGLDFYHCTDPYFESWEELQTITGSSCEAPRFVDNLDGSVTDNLTGLVWQKTDDLGGITDKDNSYSWTDLTDGDSHDEDGTAFTVFLEQLNAGAGYAGANGWRLPTFAELLTILEPDCTVGPCVDPVFGPVDTEPVSQGHGYYFSATSDEFLKEAAWVANFTGGFAYEAFKKDSFHVRAVRHGF
jgi:hypothetical protein